MIESDWPILSLLLLWPFFSALVIAFCSNATIARRTALYAALIELLLSLVAVTCFNPVSEDFQLVENYTWIPSLPIRFQLGIDGITILFLPASALMTVLAIVMAWHTATLTRLHWVLLLLLESFTMGVFSALDLVLFFLFWQLTLPPLFFLIGLWGIGPLRRSIATKHAFFMLFAGVPILLAIVILAINHAGSLDQVSVNGLSFSLPELLTTLQPENQQILVFFLFLLGFAVRVPLAPFHTWLPVVAIESPIHIVAVLTGLKLGVYGIIRFAMPLAPSAAVEYSGLLGILGASTLIYTGLIALRQSNLRALLAYASISQAGLVLMGLASLNQQGMQGALFQLLNFPLVMGGLFMVAGFIHHRLGSTELVHLGGLAKVLPQLTVCYLFFTVASMGMPGTNGFPAQLLLIIGTLLAHPSLGVMALVGLVLAVVYPFSFIRQAYFGAVRQPTVVRAHDLVGREKYVVSVFVVLVLWLGFFPNTVLNTQQKTVEAWLVRLLAQPKVEGEVADNR